MSTRLLFLYPHTEFFTHMPGFRGEQTLRAIDDCIDQRYRAKGVNVHFAVYRNRSVEGLTVHASDRVHAVEYTFEQSTYGARYARPSRLLRQILPVDTVWIAGFHYWDCIQRVARSAHKRGLHAVVDEDLTELFQGRIRHPQFTATQFAPQPPLDPVYRKLYDIARKNRPWLLT
jgi:hypothetical protein